MTLSSQQLRDEDSRIEAQRRGSAALVSGWIILGMALFCGLLTFETFRDGTVLWRYMTFTMGAVGLILVSWGSLWRKRNG